MCINRDDMPQVDFADYNGLLHFLEGRGVRHRRLYLPVPTLVMKQCVEQTRAARNLKLLTKPLLTSIEPCVLDGNHRLMMHKEWGHTDVECIQIMLPFDKACAEILAYPGAYRYADGPQPYRI